MTLLDPPSTIRDIPTLEIIIQQHAHVYNTHPLTAVARERLAFALYDLHEEYRYRTGRRYAAPQRETDNEGERS